MSIAIEPTPKLQFFTKDALNFADMVKQSARLFVLGTKSVPDDEHHKSNHQREVVRTSAALFESMLALMNPFNVAVVSYSQLKVSFTNDRYSPAVIEFTANAFAHPKDGDPRETKEEIYAIRLTLGR